MTDLFNYKRRESSEVNVGGTPLGGNNPIRIQSMTTTSTNDTEASVAQSERIIDAGGEYVRLTTQGVREAENLKNINAMLRADGYMAPIVADVHFNPHVAEVAALYAEKVRINPGNYVDPARTFKSIEYTNSEYAGELRKIEERFVPFLNICRMNNTAIRIGVNHGSLSDRIMSRYGDTPEGIVESCMEFLRICKREDFHNVVISIKASNTVVMVLSVRLLVSRMEEEDMHYPLHLGVTEAGEGEDGRIKSAVGIGALLADGIGDTIRVSLSEEPEKEIPVARYLTEYISQRAGHLPIPATEAKGFNYLHPERRRTVAIGNIGGENPPVVISSIRTADCKEDGIEDIMQSKADYIYAGNSIPEGIGVSQSSFIVDFQVYKEQKKLHPHLNIYPIFPHNSIPFISQIKADMKFLVLQYGVSVEEYAACMRHNPDIVAVCISNHRNRLGEQRALVHEMMNAGVSNPVVFCGMYAHNAADKEKFQLEASADMGALMFDGLCDGIWLMNNGDICPEIIEDTAFGILQAARLRTTKTEYISCPGCGRTLYDLRTTIARIKEATKDMKGLKIAIMGCIVNGPGEMADADYGYVGAGRGKISLYRKKECVAKNIPEEEAVDRLLELVNSDMKQ
ncbi:4-hydroxy-3-methylbut-2-en-1-yl diphosphate synthase [Xylanibacter muris]|uniref:4-hydroxy-3-methylbut-2-en-1-yl diphosphate synthase (flavodoxin) n=1 Tax=Xylanibacter muris TaxID=2736290 RepID=A0ABX2AIP5_9BACT|nr:4-hydroxy-3-methylbut-2-en-1-yl diphosphate synthase [Xylanibacter muris]NPD90861.1 4-hydroxy-3-methylbut-2-en-1-yl diphosphate synthase [Xylanibacter muris]